MKKYQKEGITEVVTVLGVYKKENNELLKALKVERKRNKRQEKEFEGFAKMAEEKARLDWVEKGQLKTSIATLQQLLKRASNGLSTKKLVNVENLTPKQVKEILDKALEAWEEADAPKEQCNDNCGLGCFGIDFGGCK